MTLTEINRELRAALKAHHDLQLAYSADSYNDENAGLKKQTEKALALTEPETAKYITSRKFKE